MDDARLLSTAGGESFALEGREQCVIGSAADADIHIDEPGIAARHCVLEYRADRWLIGEFHSGTCVNGLTLAGATRLFDRDVIAISPEHQWEFVSGERRTAELPLPVANASRARRRASGHSADGFESPTRPFSWRVFGLLVMASLFIVIAALAVWYERRAAIDNTAILTDRQAIQFDSLLIVAYDHLERGNSLLELGIADEAANEFARGINTLALSDLRNHPQAKPRITALESSVAAMYRERRLAVPDAYVSATSTIAPDKIRTAALTREQFEHAFDLVSGEFRLRFGRAIVVVGRDHAEHLTLYGKGGALDLRSMTMTPQQIAFVVTQCRSYGIRVKDFSQDSILRRQVRAAINAGLPERAGTGLHLHIDRFADRRDRWTISGRGERAPDELARPRYTNRNFSRVMPDSVNSVPSSSSFGSPRSSSSLSIDVPLRLESMM